MTNQFKEKLLAGKRMIGTEVDLCNPCITEMVGQFGFDFIWIDTEHEANDYHTTLMHIIAARAAGTASMVRIPWNEPYLAKRILEMGPDAIVFPMVNTAEELQKAADACMYPPYGKRGFGPRRCSHYGADDMMEYIQDAPNRVCCLAQLESAEAVRNLDEMLKIPHVDGFILGPCDLSGSINLLHQLDHPEVMAFIDLAIEKCRRAGRAIGLATGTTTEEEYRFWYDRGIQFLSAGNDISAIVAASRKRFEEMSRVFYQEQ